MMCVTCTGDLSGIFGARWFAYVPADAACREAGHVIRQASIAPEDPPDLGPDCEECEDGRLVSDTCDECGERHCPECEPCPEGP